MKAVLSACAVCLLEHVEQALRDLADVGCQAGRCEVETQDYAEGRVPEAKARVPAQQEHPTLSAETTDRVTVNQSPPFHSRPLEIPRLVAGKATPCLVPRPAEARNALLACIPAVFRQRAARAYRAEPAAVQAVSQC